MATKKISYLGGLNTTASLQGIPDGQMQTLIDYVLRGNSLQGRFGAYKIDTLSGTPIVTGIAYFPVSGTGNEYIVAYDFTNNKVYAVQVTTTAMTFADITGAASLNFFTGFAILNGILFIGTGTSGIYKWTGAGNISAVGGSSPSAVGPIFVVNNFLFAAGYLTSTFYWSNVADGTTWSAANTLDFRKGDGDFITELSSINSDLVIFKNYSTGRLSTVTTTVSGIATLAPLTTVSESQGCIGFYAADKLPDGRIALAGADNHAYLFDGSIFTDISDREYPLGNIQTSLESLNIHGPTNVRVTVNPIRHEVWFNFNRTFIFAFDYVNNIWSRRAASTIACMCVAKSSSTSWGGFQSIDGTSLAVLNSQMVLLMGDTVGNIWIDDIAGQNDVTGSPNSRNVVWSFNLPADDRENVAVQFIVPITCSAASKTITYFVGRNGTYGSSQTFTSTGGIDRIRIPLVFTSRESSQQVKILLQTTDTWTIDEAYLSNDRPA